MGHFDPFSPKNGEKSEKSGFVTFFPLLAQLHARNQKKLMNQFRELESDGLADGLADPILQDPNL